MLYAAFKSPGSGTWCREEFANTFHLQEKYFIAVESLSPVLSMTVNELFRKFNECRRS
jgi:hypothetical protein